jgi:hypothetical protein
METGATADNTWCGHACPRRSAACLACAEEVQASLRDRTPSPPPAAAAAATARESDEGNAADARTCGHKRPAASSLGVDDASPRQRRRRDDPAASRTVSALVDNDDDDDGGGGTDAAVDESGATVDLQPSRTAADRDKSSAPAYSSVVDQPSAYSSVVNDAAAALRAQLSPSSRHACLLLVAWHMHLAQRASQTGFECELALKAHPYEIDLLHQLRVMQKRSEAEQWQLLVTQAAQLLPRHRDSPVSGESAAGVASSSGSIVRRMFDPLQSDTWDAAPPIPIKGRAAVASAHVRAARVTARAVHVPRLWRVRPVPRVVEPVHAT